MGPNDLLKIDLRRFQSSVCLRNSSADLKDELRRIQSFNLLWDLQYILGVNRNVLRRIRCLVCLPILLNELDDLTLGELRRIQPIVELALDGSDDSR